MVSCAIFNLASSFVMIVLTLATVDGGGYTTNILIWVCMTSCLVNLSARLLWIILYLWMHLSIPQILWNITHNNRGYPCFDLC